MDVYINKNEKIVEWNVGEKVITIHNEHVLYAWLHGKNMLMIREGYEASEDGISTYDKEGNLVFSFKFYENRITFKEMDITEINGAIISADYEEEKRKLVVLKEAEEISSLLIYDEKGDLLAEIKSPSGYTFVSLKNYAGNIMVVAQGTKDMTRDPFGRNDWNFVIDFEYFSVQKNQLYSKNIQNV